MTPLTLLALGTNSFISSIPSSMGSLSRLSYLQMSFNRLTGTVPPTVGCLTRLTWIGGANHASNWLIQRNNESTPVKNFEHSPSEENCMTREVLPPELVSALVLGTPIQAGGEVVQNAWHKLLLFPHFSLWMSWIPARVLSCSFCLYPWNGCIFRRSSLRHRTDLLLQRQCSTDEGVSNTPVQDDCLLASFRETNQWSTSWPKIL